MMILVVTSQSVPAASAGGSGSGIDLVEYPGQCQESRMRIA